MIKIEIILKSFVDLFASGRSYAKVLLFFVFFIYVGILLYFRKRRKNDNRIFKNISFSILLLISLVGISIHLFNIYQLGVSPGKRILYLSENEITSSELLHIHELKGTFGMFATSFNEGIDMGVAALDHVPHYLLWLVLILLVMAVITYGLSIYNNEYKDRKTVLFYAFIFFILMKNSIDGGLLNYEVVALFLFFLTYISIKKGNGFYVVIPLIPLFFIGMFSFYFFRMLETYIFICALYSLLFLKIKWIRIILSGIIVLLIILNARPNISYVELETQESPTYVASFLKNDQSKLLYSVGNMYLYEEKGNVKVKDLLKKYEVFDNQRPVSIEWKTCMPNMYDRYTFMIRSDKAPKNMTVNKNNMYKLSIEPVGKNIYKTNLNIYGCYAQRFENQVQEGLREVELLPAIVYSVNHEQK